jgi:2-oxoisovalerate dehydrogenase E1 component
MDTALDSDLGRHLLREMLRIRRFEEKCAELYSAGHIRGFLHLYIGEEAVAVGLMQALAPDDGIVATYREHGHALARGISADALMAEMFGKQEGCSRGRGGSMHVFDAATRFYGGNAIVGGGLPIAVGLALADVYLGRRRVTTCIFGDGAVAEGEFHESMNLACLWKLPVLFVCENNLYAMGTRIERALSVTDLSARARSYGMAAEPVDGMDVVAVERAARQAVEAARVAAVHVSSSAGPIGSAPTRCSMPSCIATRRRSRNGRPAIRSSCCVPGCRQRTLWTTRRWRRWRRTSSRRSTEPLHSHTPARGSRSNSSRGTCIRPGRRKPMGASPVRRTTYREAVREAIRDALQRDPRVFLMGEDVGRYGGAYAVSKGLLAEFGPERIRDTPLSESTFVGAGIGAALGGARPIVEVMTVNFSLLALDQIVNNAATIRHMSGGQFSVPLVIRMATGAGRQLAAQHAHSLEGWFAHVPGLRIVTPATLEDARGMLWTALEDPDPVLIFEHQTLYNMEGEVAVDAGPVDIDRAVVRRAGRDVTLVTYGGTLFKTLAAADTLAGEGIDAAVIDLRTLRPLDMETVLGSVRATRRVVVVDEGWRSGSLSAEILARVTESAFFDLDAPVSRVCSAEVPIPYPRHLEDAATPQPAAITEAVRALVTARAASS